MLVTKITLEVSTTRVIEGATAIVPKFDSTEKNSILRMTLFMPKNIDGDILFDIEDAIQDNLGLSLSQKPPKFLLK